MGSNSNTLFTKAVPVALGMGVLFSPDTLALLGNIMGKTGWSGLGLMLGAMVVFFIHAVNIQNMDQCNLQTHFNGLVVYLPWTARVFIAVFLSTGILVSAGFVFNEVFLHWFPNFGFAFLLLTLVLVLNLMGTSIAFKTQVVFVGLTITGLILLILTGLFFTGKPSTVPMVQFPDKSAFFLPLLLWTGFDLGSFARNQKKNQAKKIGHLVITIALSGILFLLWGMAGSEHLEIWIRAGLILWLFSYGLIAAAVLKQGFSLAKAVGFTLTMTGVIFLLLSREEQFLRIIYFFIILGAGLVPGIILIRKSSNKHAQSKP